MNTTAPAASTATPSEAGHGRIAVVCRAGDEAAKSLTAFLEQLGVQAITGGAGATPSPESLEQLREVEFAILMRSDRALETGFLLGALGAKRLCLLLPPQGSAPGLESLSRVPLDADGLWRLLLARHLKQAGLDIDMNKAI
jgi:hypothetical protein